MAKASDLDVAYVSKLARLNLTDEETQLFQKQLFGVFQNVGQLLLEKLRLLVRQIESRQFRHVSDVEVGCFGHKSKVEMIKQPNRREQNGDHENQKYDTAFAPFFAQRAARFSRSDVAITFVFQCQPNIQAADALARAHE